MREIDDTIKFKDIVCSKAWIIRMNFVKMSTLLKAIYRFNVIPVKTPMAFLTDAEKAILKFVWNRKDCK